MKRKATLASGDLVRVKPLSEILETLDDHGCLDRLPFMTEMIEHCGKTFRVSRKIEKTCVDAQHFFMGEFINNDVYFLDQLRCSGLAHAGCQRGCMLFWKEGWLQRVDEETPVVAVSQGTLQEAELKLQKQAKQDRYYCQSSELENATVVLSKTAKLVKLFAELRNRTYGVPKVIALVALPMARRIVRGFIGIHPRGRFRKTPVEELNLHPGEVVEVKSLQEIKLTLDVNGKNRGLGFEPDMKDFCGKRFKVRNRIDRMILEKDGRMIQLHNTVILESVTCKCFYAVGGCYRKEYQYWREIWLRRVA